MTYQIVPYLLENVPQNSDLYGGRMLNAQHSTFHPVNNTPSICIILVGWHTLYLGSIVGYFLITWYLVFSLFGIFLISVIVELYLGSEHGDFLKIKPSRNMYIVKCIFWDQIIFMVHSTFGLIHINFQSKSSNSCYIYQMVKTTAIFSTFCSTKINN